MAGMVLCLGFALFSPRPVLELGFGIHGETLTEAENYLQIFSLTIPLNLLLFIYSSVFKIFRKTGIIFWYPWERTCSISLLDYGLIFGTSGIAGNGNQRGCPGNGNGSCSESWLLCLSGEGLCKILPKRSEPGKDENRSFGFPFLFWDRKLWKTFFFVVGLNGIVARLGVTELAAYNLIAQFTNLILMPMFSYTAANTSLVSEWAGKGDRKQADKAGRYTFGLLCIWFAVFYMILVLGRTEFARLISPDTEVIALAAACMPLASADPASELLWKCMEISLQSLGWQNGLSGQPLS